MINRLPNADLGDKKPHKNTKARRSREEIFNCLANCIRNAHDEDISEEESRKLARNFINFCQKFVEIQVRLEKEKELKNYLNQN
ncbi:hypothetical protein [Candidatus Tisiphia endosymbiont of Temnostethus pusillus]|uniref:hypothetical protein n=1 Tax=Candidatus Tisiphia endosymbiont of Temnostethus pusillus TaxID=3139335 RepID=UPI0035C917A2